MSSPTNEAVVEKQRLASPNKYMVIFLNDNVTPMEYVIQVLLAFYGKTTEEANDITVEVHEKGRSTLTHLSLRVSFTTILIFLNLSWLERHLKWQWRNIQKT